MRDDAGVEAQATEIPPELLRYARAMWGAELVGALLYRADTLALTAMAEPRVVGVYGIALQLGNTVRSLRGAFEPLVVAVCSGLSGSGTRASLRDATSYATLLIVASQLLVTGFVACFGTWLLSLFGSGFRAALLPSILLCLGWTLHGSVAIAGAVLSGLGQARSVFGSSLLTLAVLTLSLAVLVPALGAEGAALAVTGSFVAQAVLQQRMVRRHLGAPLYADALVGRLRHFGAGTLCAVVAWLTLGPGVAAAWVAFAIVCAAVLPTLFCWLRRPDQIAMETAT